MNTVSITSDTNLHNHPTNPIDIEMKKIIKPICALLFNIFMGAIIASLLGLPAWTGASALVAVGFAMSFVPGLRGCFRAGVYAEIWTGEVVKDLRGGLAGSWLDGIPDQSTLVENDVIHLAKIGVQPDVLVNNKTYPIPKQVINDEDIAIKLDKFQTKRTPVTDDELYAISYDKMARVKELHADAITDKKFAKAAHSLCANKHTAKTPVLTTTGDVDPNNGRRRLRWNDLVALKESLDKLGVPDANRRLVLCPEHVNDLLLVSQSFQTQYNIDRNTGKIGHLAGFDIYTYAKTPVYTTEGVKKDLDAAAVTGEFNCSFAFYTQRVFKATGSTKMYYREATLDPENQESSVNFRHYFIAMPKVADAGAVMVSGYVAPAEEKAPEQDAQG